MPNMFMDALTAGKKEANDVTKLTNSVSQNIGMGAQKDGLIQLAREVGMPQGYENKINMMRDPDGLGVIAKEILDKQGGIELFRGGKSVAMKAMDGANVDESAILSEMGVETADALSPLQQIEFKDKVNNARSMSTGRALIEGSEDYDTYRMASSLVPGTSKSGMSDAQKISANRLQDKFEMEEDKRFTKWGKDQIEESRKAVSANYIEFKDLLNSGGSLNDTLNDMQDQMLRKLKVNGKPITEEQLDQIVKSSHGQNLMDIVTTSPGYIQNFLGKVGSTFGFQSLELPSNDQIAIRATKMRYLADYVRSMSGLAVTEKEFKNLQNILGMAETNKQDQFYSNIVPFMNTMKKNAEKIRQDLITYSKEKFITRGSTYKGKDASEFFAPEIEVLDRKIADISNAINSFSEMSSKSEEVSRLIPGAKDGKGGHEEVKPKEKVKKRTSFNTFMSKKASEYTMYNKTKDRQVKYTRDENGLVRDDEGKIVSNGILRQIHGGN